MPSDSTSALVDTAKYFPSSALRVLMRQALAMGGTTGPLLTYSRYKNAFIRASTVNRLKEHTQAYV